MKSKKLNKKSKNLYDLLGNITDYRRAQAKVHELRLILIIAIMAIMSGFDGVRAMGDFVKKNHKKLLKLFQPSKNKLPSRKTIERALKNTNFDELNKTFRDWAINHTTIEEKDWISADGKAIGGTVSNSQNKFQQFTSLISLFASKQKQVISADKINNKKESEIPKLKDLVEQLGVVGIKGAVITADALHCQKDTIAAIVKSKNDYCLGVKGNQKKLHKQIKKKCKKK